MPKKVDPQQRRQEIAQALWRVAHRDGWEAISLRQVAAEAGVSMGLVQHYFTSKDEMLGFAMERITTDLGQRVTAEVGALPEPRDPRQVVEIILTEMMPREGDEHSTEAQAAVAFGLRVARRPELAAHLVTQGATFTAYLAGHVRAGRVDQRIDPELTAAGLLALVEGLIAHTLFGRQSAASARAVLRAQLDLVFGR